MASLLASNYLVRQPIEAALKRLCLTLPLGAVVYDVGCGHQPYAPLFAAHTYVGIDTDPTSSATVQYTDGEAIPLPDASADFIMCTQTLQHTQNPVLVMNEIHRLLKPGGHAFVTVPFGIKMVAEPYPTAKAPQQNFSVQAIPRWRDDYWRFTKYGLLVLAKEFTVISLTDATGYGGTLCQLLNYGVASLNLGLWMAPLYFISNCLGLAVDKGVKQLAQYIPRGEFFYDAVYSSFTSNYIAVLKKP